jgi:hypothetical protein
MVKLLSFVLAILIWKSNVTILNVEQVSEQDMDAIILDQSGKQTTGRVINGVLVPK